MSNGNLATPAAAIEDGARKPRLARKAALGMLWALALILGSSSAFAAEPAEITVGPTEPAQAESAEGKEAEPKLLGDLGGLRPALAKYGISLELGYIGETFGVVRGGVRRGATYDGQAAAGIDIDLEKLVGWPRAKIYANAFQLHGRQPSQVLLGGNLMPVSSIETFPTTRLYRLWFEQSLYNDRASVRIGQIAADDEFITSETAGGLINNTYGWPLLTGANTRGGGPAYPLPQPGIRLQVKPISD